MSRHKYTLWSTSPRPGLSPLSGPVRSKSAESRISTASVHPDYVGHKVIFYKNGDFNDTGLTLSLNYRQFPTFSCLLTYLSSKIFLPGGVHKIYTIKGRTVTRLTQFKDQHEYIACGSFLMRGDYGRMRRVTDRYDVNVPASPRYPDPPFLDDDETSRPTPRSFHASPLPMPTLANYPN